MENHKCNCNCNKNNNSEMLDLNTLSLSVLCGCKLPEENKKQNDTIPAGIFGSDLQSPEKQS